MIRVPILAVPVRHWHCPHCPARDATRQAGPHTRFHGCGALGGFNAPMVEVGIDATTVVHERDDYVGREAVQLTPAGRPVMAISTEYGDGRRDVAVYPPTATARGTA